MILRNRMPLLIALVASLSFDAGIAIAGLGRPTDWQVNMQESASSVMDGIVWFHALLLYIVTAITLFVLALLVYCAVRFNAKANPIPTRTTHNTTIEILWTVVPVIILMAIAVPSFRELFKQLQIPPADITVKATGKQWFWTYSYPDQGNLEFDSLLVQDKDRKPDQLRLLSVDNPMVVPVNKVVRVQTIGADVIHAFGVPSLGVKMDAVPGRLNEIWFKATKEGVYYGQCFELCGRDHAFMPIEVRVVSDEAFAAWLAESKQKFSDSRPAREPSPAAVALNQSALPR